MKQKNKLTLSEKISISIIYGWYQFKFWATNYYSIQNYKVLIIIASLFAHAIYLYCKND